MNGQPFVKVSSLIGLWDIFAIAPVDDCILDRSYCDMNFRPSNGSLNLRISAVIRKELP